MSQPLPTGGLRWVDIKVKELSTREDGGYLMEVDVFQPRKLQDNQNELPFVCKKMKIRNVYKLVADLYYKKRYVIHIRALQQALDHGSKKIHRTIEKIHRTIEFKQSP